MISRRSFMRALGFGAPAAVVAAAVPAAAAPAVLTHPALPCAEIIIATSSPMEIRVAPLSAITANLGTVEAGHTLLAEAIQDRYGLNPPKGLGR